MNGTGWLFSFHAEGPLTTEESMHVWFILAFGSPYRTLASRLDPSQWYQHQWCRAPNVALVPAAGAKNV